MAQAVQWAGPTRTAPARHCRTPARTPAPAELGDMLSGSEVVGRQTLAQEAERGSDTFARTATHATATLTGDRRPRCRSRGRRSACSRRCAGTPSCSGCWSTSSSARATSAAT